MPTINLGVRRVAQRLLSCIRCEISKTKIRLAIRQTLAGTNRHQPGKKECDEENYCTPTSVTGPFWQSQIRAGHVVIGAALANRADRPVLGRPATGKLQHHLR